MLIPLRHENMEGRRLPIVTFALIGLNLLIFLATHWKIEEQQPERAEVRSELLLLAAGHPELNMSGDAQKFVEEVKSKVPEATWQKLSTRRSKMQPKPQQEEEWDGETPQGSEEEQAAQYQAQLQSQMDSLCQRFEESEKNSILDNYAFVPGRPRPIAYLTSMFLHSGWLHLIGNMWFLWLSGFVLEDRWGRVIYPIFYVLAGMASTLVHAMFYPHSLAPMLGASGAVAALMGGFLVRFPKMKIRMLWYLFIFRIKFNAPAYTLLPLWLLMEVFYGSLFGQLSGVAHWAHVGGFLFGALGAFLIGKTGLEHQANEVIENKIGWTADPAIVKGTESLEKGNFDEGIAGLEAYVATKPDSADAYALLRQLYWRKNNVPKYLEATIKVCQLNLKAQNGEAAWQDYQEFTNSGGEKMPAATWLELCRIAEGQQEFDVAVKEYEKLAKTYPTEKQSILALLSAGRLSLKQLNRPSDALVYYKAAQASKVPHLDWDTNIQAGVAAAEKAAGASLAPVAKF